jgi:hypothetical protein|tara:strand:+ start:1160 stop:1348 length:189 start_codon:yes stop_codon:yes gene_type:complete
MSAWTDFVTKFYHEKKEQNKDYKFKDALKDGAKVYKKENAKKVDTECVKKCKKEATKDKKKK